MEKKLFLKMNVLSTWFESFPSAAHHINSFVDWSEFGLQKTFSSQSLSSKTKQWSFKNVRLTKPEITVEHAQRFGLTYDAKVILDIVETCNDNSIPTRLNDIVVARVPVIVLPTDVGSDGIGGYFVISGIKRVLITQIRNSYNQPIVTFAKDSKKNRTKPEDIFTIKPSKLTDCLKSKSTSEAPDKSLRGDVTKLADSLKEIHNKSMDLIELSLKLRSISEVSNHSCETEIVVTKHGQFLLSNSKFKGRISVPIIMKALGCISVDHFASAVSNDLVLAKKLYIMSLVVYDRIEALQYLADRLIFVQRTVEDLSIDVKDVVTFLTFQLFPHLGLDAQQSLVAVYIGSLVSRISEVKRIGKADDRDSLRFKRFEPAGILIGDLFEQIVKKWTSQLTKHCETKDDLVVGIKISFITSKLIYCFKSGIWGLQTNYKRMGVCQPKVTTSFIGGISHLYRVSNPISKETRNQPVRQLHPTHAFNFCAVESPEGHTVGLVLNLAIATMISARVVPVVVIDSMAHLIRPIEFCGRDNTFTVFVNGRLIGTIDNLKEFVDEFVLQRRLGKFDGGLNQGMVSIGIINSQVMIWCDEGRLVRIVKTSLFDNSVVDWREGLLSGKLQWIDSFEQEFGPEKFDWGSELDPSTLFGIAASTIPFINFQPAPRAVFASSMNKQAISSIGPTQAEEFGTTLNIGRVQHEPIVSTLISKIKKLDDYPTGVNVIVAICPINGYNQEDSIVLNRSSVERGLFAADVYKTIEVEESYGDSIKKFGIPHKSIRHRTNNYCLLDSNGVVKKGSRVSVGDVLVGLISKGFSGAAQGSVEVDVSYVVGKGEEGIVHKVYHHELEGFKHLRIVICGNLEVVVGDKFSSRFGQKGICGLIANSWDLPFMEDGCVPDIFINPLCLPSRMTIPTLMEGMFGLVSLETKQKWAIGNFKEHPDIRVEMEKFGIHPSGTVWMRNPVNGKRMKKIFCSPMYYQRLAHLAIPKCYARSTGVMSKHTRQPTDGRSRKGGLRFGEMEGNCIVGLNMPFVLEDRLFHCSDPFTIYVCKECKLTALNSNSCLCGSEQIKAVKMSFSSNLIFNQLKSMGVLIHFGLEDPKSEIEEHDSSLPMELDEEEEEVLEEEDFE